jgi:cytochrome c
MILRLIAATAISLIVVPSAQAQGDVGRGAETFRQCVACHSLDPGYHLTGPSLFGIIGRPAGKAKNFKRYSEALKVADFSWTLNALDQWLENPDKLVPGTSMRIRPIADVSMRQDIIAFLKSSPSSVSENKGKNRMPDLKQVPPGQLVTSLMYCPDAYQVTVATGNTFTIWEFNLRFKTDSSSNGPLKGKPVLVG